MSSPEPGPIVQRSCALCGVVDGTPRAEYALPSGHRAFYHLPGSPDCRVPEANPHPEYTEGGANSQLRHALTQDGGSETPADSAWLGITVTDASVPGDASTWTEGFEPGTEPALELVSDQAETATTSRKKA